MRKTTKTGRYAKIAASAVALLLLGVVTSAALAEDSPFSALDALTGSTSTSTTTTSEAPAEPPAPTTTQSVFAPTVSSDKGDYAPGELVTLRGTNWHAGEAVHVYVNDDQGRTWERDSDVVADENGEIIDSFNLPNWFVATYAVVATGATSGAATAAFTDANPQLVQIGPGSLSVTPGSSAVYTVTIPMNGNSNPCTLDLSASGLPTGATATFGSTSITGTSSASTSATIATTAATPLGTSTFTVTAKRQANCQGNGDQTGTANLVVAAACTAASVVTQPSNQSITYGANATFTAAGAGNPAPSVQWQVSTNGGSTWTNLSGDTGTTLTVTKPGVGQSGNQYRAVFTNTCGGTQTATSNAATLTVAAKSVTITPDSGQSKVYSANDPTLTYTSSAALESGDSFAGTLARVAGENAGSYAITLGTLSAGSNYGLSLASTPVNFAINAKQTTITPDSGQSKVYGASDPALTFTNDGGLTASAFTGALGRAAGENAGSYAITLGNLSAGSNYAITLSTPPVPFAITKKPATVAAEDQSKVYGSDDPALTTTNSGFLAADLGPGKITFSATRANGDTVAGSPYTITPAAADAATNLLGNYQVTIETGQLTITKKAVTGSFTASDKVYNGNTNATVPNRGVNGIVEGDKVDLVGGSAAFDTKNAGTAKTVTLTGATLSGDDAGNYSLQSVATASANITPKPITVTADNKTKVYGSADPELTVTVPAGALEQGDSLSGSLVRADGKDVGSYAITKGSLTAGGNYELTVTPGSLTITKKAITVKADDKTKVYGSADPALTVTVPAGALEQGDSLSGSLVRAPGSNVGGYAITIGSLTAGGNYDLTVTPGTLTITKKAITLTADDKTKVLGAADPTLTFKVTSGSLESGDSVSGSLVRAPGETIGTYPITQGTLTAGGNYALTFVGATLKIVYGWDGFLQPINDTAHQTGVQQSKFKLGQTIPAKFVLKNAAGAVVRQTTDPTFTRSGNLGACDSTASPDTTEAATPDAGSTYTWDGSQYHYNWSTKNLTAGEYRIYANLADGTKQYVDICLSK